VRMIVSDLNLTESLAGNHLASFPSGIANVLALSPKWLYLTGMAAREVIVQYGDSARAWVTTSVGSFLEWQDLLPLIAEADAISDIADLDKPTAKALIQAYPPGSIAARMKYWKDELNELRGELRWMLTFVQSPQNLFRKLVASTLRMNLGSTR